MPQADPITLLLANEQAEEIKLVTISMRGFYPGCRIEAVYSAEEALEWASKQDWHVILLDEQLSPRSGLDILPELRQRAPNAAVIVQTEQTDAATAVEAMRAGADYYLFKKSPAFLTELMIITREILEKRELRTRLDLTHERYLRLIETMTDMVYELDTEGRFVHVSPAFAILLGYNPQELIGIHYSKFVHSDAARIAERRFNERRTGVRATRNLELRLVTRTGTVKQTNVLEIEVAATGLYNRQRQFLGTVGVVRDINRHKQEQARIQRLEEQLRQTDRLMELGRSVVKVAHELSSPLTSILDDTERLLKKVQDLQLENQLEVVASQASRAAQIGKALVAYTQPQPLIRLPVSINRVIEDVLSLASTDLRVHSIQVKSHLAQTLPEILGDTSRLQQVFLSLITQSGRTLQECSQGGRLLVTTRVVGAQEIPSFSASLPAPAPTSYVEVAIIPEGQGKADREEKSASEPGFEWSAASRIIQEHGGVIEADTPPSGTRVRVWLPAIEMHQPSHAGSIAGVEESQEQPTFPRTSPPHESGTTTLLEKEQVILHPERRRSSRIDVRTETRLALEGTTWEGTTLNISQGGAYMVFEGVIPATENQPIRIGLVSDVGVLELPATLRGIREVIDRRVEASANPSLGLAVEFGELGSGERLILASLLDGLQERSVSVKLTVLLTPQETGDLLLEVSSSGTDTGQLAAIHPGPPELEDTSPPERRLAARVNLAVPAQVETQDSSSNIQQHRALTVNLSMGGACIRLQARPNLLGRRLLLRLFPPSDILPNQPSGTSAGSPDCTVTGEVIWITPDTTVPAELREGVPASALRMGLQLLHLNDEGERALEQLIARFLTSPLRSEERSETTRLVSVLMECWNELGQRITVYHDHPREGLPPGAPLVIISPGYGETKKEYIALAYYLASNGFQVLRYDHTNHVGDSEGDIVQTTLTGMRQDLSALLGYAKRTWPTSHIAVVATSLTCLVALKQMVTQDSSVELLVLLTPVVDLRATLVAVHQEDHIDAFLRGVRLGVMNVLGFNVNADRFLNDAVKEGYTDLQTTIKDIQRVHTPVIFFAAEHDVWVSLDSVKKVQAVLPAKLSRLYLVPEALHSLRENPRKARSVFRQVVTCCLKQFYPFTPEGEMLKPSQREIGLQGRLERERARIQRNIGKAENIEFWRDYLAHYHYIVNSSDYWHLLDSIYSLLGMLERGTRVLDAGCGNGNFGMFLLINQAYRQRNAPGIKAEVPHYIGVDFVPSALAQTRLNLANVADELRSKIPASAMTKPFMRISLSLADLNRPLPFRDEEFGRIICNLVISYLQDPLFTLRELMRVLSPNGRLIVTNLKPQADLSQIYRNFIQVAKEPAEVEQGRQILSNSGKIRQGESEGIFRFFEKQELTMLLISSGAVRPRIYSAFANQAYIAVAEKPDSSG